MRPSLLKKNIVMLTVNIEYLPYPLSSVASRGQAHASTPTRYQAAFQLAAGQCLGLMGASGAGKTSLLMAIAGLLQPTAGQIHMHESCWFDHAKQVQLAPHLRPVGMVFQEGRLFPHLSVAQNLRYGMPRAKHAHDQDSVSAQITWAEVIEMLAIDHLLTRKPSQLSGGEQQRVALGRALLRQPQLLLMDEPLSGLDQTLKQQVLPYIQQVIKRFGLPTMYVSHHREEIEGVADSVWVLAQGELQEERLAG